MFTEKNFQFGSGVYKGWIRFQNSWLTSNFLVLEEMRKKVLSLFGNLLFAIKEINLEASSFSLSSASLHINIAISNHPRSGARNSSYPEPVFLFYFLGSGVNTCFCSTHSESKYVKYKFTKMKSRNLMSTCL